MDSYRFIDSIQLEKANALARYKRFNNISKVIRFMECFIAVALISWSSTRLPTVFKVFSEYLYACSCYMLNQHIVFLVGNIIVIICYALSSNNNNSNSNSNSNNDVESLTARPVIQADIKYKYKYASTSNTNGYKTNVTASNTEELIGLPDRKHAVKEDNHDNEVIPNNTNANTTKCQEATETVIKQAAKQIERFKRTQSVKLRQEMTVKPRAELRRSVTERRRSVVNGGDGCETTSSSVETVERLSNEEFRLRVEAFIKKQQQSFEAAEYG